MGAQVIFHRCREVAMGAQDYLGVLADIGGYGYRTDRSDWKFRGGLSAAGDTQYYISYVLYMRSTAYPTYRGRINLARYYSICMGRWSSDVKLGCFARTNSIVRKECSPFARWFFKSSKFSLLQNLGIHLPLNSVCLNKVL